MSTNQKFLNVLDYIERNLTENISLQELAQIAGYSVPQFYRLFKRLTGDTVKEYLLRRKMSEAAIELKNNDESIADIAYKYGFQSHDVFTRGFLRVYGITPRKYRQSDATLPPLKQLVIGKQHKEENTRQMTFSVCEVKEFKVIGMECEASTWDSDGAIGRLWCEFLDRVEEITEVTEPMTMYGICEEETCQGDKFTYMAAVAVDKINNVPEGMSIRTIRNQKFFQAKVPEEILTPDAYMGTVNYAKSLGFSIETYDEIEAYDAIFHDPDVSEFRLLIPVR